LERPVGSRCDKGNYYLVNNYNPGYFGDGSNAYTDANATNTVYTRTQTACTATSATSRNLQPIKSGKLPAVSFVKPSGFVDGQFELGEAQRKRT
jgi:hypothetical protein